MAPLNNPDGTLNRSTQGDLLPFFTNSPVSQLATLSDRRRTNQVLLSNYLQFEPINMFKVLLAINPFMGSNCK